MERKADLDPEPRLEYTRPDFRQRTPSTKRLASGTCLGHLSSLCSAFSTHAKGWQEFQGPLFPLPMIQNFAEFLPQAFRKHNLPPMEIWCGSLWWQPQVYASVRSRLGNCYPVWRLSLEEKNQASEITHFATQYFLVISNLCSL